MKAKSEDRKKKRGMMMWEKMETEGKKCQYEYNVIIIIIIHETNKVTRGKNDK